MELYKAANIEEGVELANELKAKGHYDWFRGQVHEWPPFSSLHRVRVSGDSEKEERAYRRISMFFEWVGGIPELKYLQKPEYVHDFFAIMQHYGIPTHYVDFTSDPGVAGFFAADTASPPTEGDSCIYCLNTDDLMSVWKTIKDFDERKGANIELVKIDVRNLWRLDAQRGVFLFADYNWDIDYPMDRIVFPYSGYPSYPTSQIIYPEDKSPLEQLLDQYLFLERATFGNEEMQRMVERLKASGRNASYVTWNQFEQGFYAEAFPDSSRMVALESWNGEALQPWESTPEEDYRETVGSTVRLKLKPHVKNEELMKSVHFGVRQTLRSDPTIRSKAVNWTVDELPASLSQKELSDMLRSVWNGMRRLPYADSEIADALASVAVLLVAGFTRESAPKHRMDVFSQCFGESLEVGFATWDGSGSQALVTRSSLQRALRPDVAELLAPEYKRFANDVHDLFRIVYNPRLMFEFSGLRSAFAREVIPTQAALKRDLILFNPANLMTFGIP